MLLTPKIREKCRKCICKPLVYNTISKDLVFFKQHAPIKLFRLQPIFLIIPTSCRNTSKNSVVHNDNHSCPAHPLSKTASWWVLSPMCSSIHRIRGTAFSLKTCWKQHLNQQNRHKSPWGDSQNNVSSARAYNPKLNDLRRKSVGDCPRFLLYKQLTL